MISRLLAGLIVTCAVVGVAASSRAEPDDKPQAAATAGDQQKDDAPDQYDAGWSPEQKAAPKPKPESAAENADAPRASEKSADAEKPAEKSKPAEAEKPAAAAKPVEPTEKPQKEAVKAPAGKEPASEPAPKAKPEAETRGAAAAASRAPRGATSTPAGVREPVRPASSPRPVGRVAEERRPEPAARSRAGAEASGVGPARTAVDGARPRSAIAPAVRRAPEPVESRTMMAAAQSTPISGGILCGGGSKWRCNWLEKEHDKFYKFTKGHNWTDQTMATDFCASEKQMRVASATRIKSVTAGCCGFVVVQVTCKR
ncbi:hypothetical protein [Methylopila sp. M107]|uniref:hypothetical protein n=1 Tax=Methylopila sp. M107 TaxID=1101190 RepID=UPI0003A56BB4|nr:hypothetical protein [Methylopila sp. M107]